MRTVGHVWGVLPSFSMPVRYCTALYIVFAHNVDYVTTCRDLCATYARRVRGVSYRLHTCTHTIKIYILIAIFIHYTLILQTPGTRGTPRNSPPTPSFHPIYGRLVRKY